MQKVTNMCVDARTNDVTWNERVAAAAAAAALQRHVIRTRAMALIVNCIL